MLTASDTWQFWRTLVHLAVQSHEEVNEYLSNLFNLENKVRIQGTVASPMFTCTGMDEPQLCGVFKLKPMLKLPLKQ